MMRWSDGGHGRPRERMWEKPNWPPNLDCPAETANLRMTLARYLYLLYNTTVALSYTISSWFVAFPFSGDERRRHLPQTPKRPGA